MKSFSFSLSLSSSAEKEKGERMDRNRWRAEVGGVGRLVFIGREMGESLVLVVEVSPSLESSQSSPFPWGKSFLDLLHAAARNKKMHAMEATFS
jgi:hypothetical protein